MVDKGLINLRIAAGMNKGILYCAEFLLTHFNTVDQKQKQWYPQTGPTGLISFYVVSP